jgi:hypothetical protein
MAVEDRPAAVALFDVDRQALQHRLAIQPGQVGDRPRVRTGRVSVSA